MNPYQSPQSDPSVKLKKSAKRDRDQCPSCLQGLMWWFDTLLISAPIFTAGNFFVLWKFGYLEEK